MTKNANLFSIPAGLDFGSAFLDGFALRFGHLPAEEVAQIEIFVNTRRMQRRLKDLLVQRGASLLPQIKLITDLGHDPSMIDIPPATPKLRRRLELSQLVSRLIAREPDLAPKEAVFDLADSLAQLLDEMQGEGVDPSILAELDVSDQSGHWQRSLEFIKLVQHFFDVSHPDPDSEGRQRRVVERLIENWKTCAPKNPVIVAGSTGSRGTTSLFMQAVARLTNGFVVLPGFDDQMPTDVWDSLEAEKGGEDHPQFRFKRLAESLSLLPTEIPTWIDCAIPNPDRAALVSLSLRPAPVTDQWLTDGPQLKGLKQATEGLTLIQAASPRAEAMAIAVRLRQAIDKGQTAALITPDRLLTRQVTSAMDRWGVVPDDSAGIPLQLTPPGRFLRHTADLMKERLTAETLLVLLKHPLCHSGQDRGQHILRTTALELHLRRYGPPFPNAASLRDWAQNSGEKDEGRADWAEWIGTALTALPPKGERPVADWLHLHQTLTEQLAAGPDKDAASGLWDKSAGREARRVLLELSLHADAGGEISARDYVALIHKLLAESEDRDRDIGHPQVLIWGTLEARVQSADLVILGGMNEGVWPEAPAPDPWLSRRMRMDAGLLLPERRIGLSAHDYQIAMNAPEVVVSRSVRSDDAETVASRWVNRLTNLLLGLGEIGGDLCHSEMVARGDALLQIASEIEAPKHQVSPAPRPSPRPPTAARPKQLSVTQIKTLIRDPYAIYARHVLGLKKLDPLFHSPDAAMRGTIIHEILERFISEGPDASDPHSRTRLMQISDDVLEEECPWPAARRFWRARIDRFADEFLRSEARRQANSTVAGLELWGEAHLDQAVFTLTCKADRMDVTEDGFIQIYDYKTGSAPSKSQQKHFDMQLLLEAAMVQNGAFKAIGPKQVSDARFIALGSEVSEVPAPLAETPADEIWDRFQKLMAKWEDVDLGYTARRSNLKVDDKGDYDHLARYGEWDETTKAKREDLS